MERENHFVPKSKINNLLTQLSKEKITPEANANLQNLCEKFVSDVINRAMMFAKHRGSDEVTSDDILFTAEKEFDYSFGIRQIKQNKNVPLDEHKEKMAEISKGK
ncbi:hypothetical protein GVAV_000961 [Gurleya vavrai]